jgi:hypothetical protein
MCQQQARKGVTSNIRKGQSSFPMPESEMRRRFEQRSYDPAFRMQDGAIAHLGSITWDGYVKERKSPVIRPAGPGFSDPAYELSVEWLAARDAILRAAAVQTDAAAPS